MTAVLLPANPGDPWQRALAAITTIVDEHAEVLEMLEGAFTPLSTPRPGTWLEAIPLDLCLENNGGGATSSGARRLTYFYQPYASITVDAVKVGCVTAGSGDTPTVCRFGLNSVAPNGDLTQVKATANDTTLFASAWKTKEFPSPATLSRGRYAGEHLYIGTGGTPPAFQGARTTAGAAFGTDASRLNGSISGASDLTSSVSAASVANTGVRYYFALRVAA